jgi:hypothetical protein
MSEHALARIRLLIAGKSPTEILSIRNELAQELASLESGLPLLTVAKVGEAGLIAARDRLEQRRLEVAFLGEIVDAPSEFLSQEQERRLAARLAPLRIAVDELLAGLAVESVKGMSSAERRAALAELDRLAAELRHGKRVQ